jgi:hypothetical protein
MKTSTKIALAAFAVLTVIFFATRESQVKVGLHQLVFSKVGADAITSIELGGPNPLSLKADNGVWNVIEKEKRYVADEAQVKAILQSLAELKASDFVTERAEKHAELEVDSTKGLTVKASTDSGVVRDFILGKASKSGGAYLRDPKSNEVFVVTGSLPWQVRSTLTQWRKKSIPLPKLDDVSKVTVATQDNSYVLGLEGTAWKISAQTAKDYTFDEKAAKQLVSQAVSLSAQDFAEGDIETTTTVTLETKEGKSHILRFGAKKTEGTYPLRVEGDPQTYLIAGWSAEQILKSPEDLRDTTLLRFDAAEVEQLTVTAAGKKVTVAKDQTSWKLVEPKTAPEFEGTQVDALLTRIQALRGLKVVRDVADAKAGISSPSVQIQLNLKGGKSSAVRFGSGGPSEGQVYVKGADGLLYSINAGEKASFEKGVELFKKPPPPPSFGGAQGLDQLPPEIRRQLEAQLRQQRR